eukprot:CAMPEP_0179001310 /NCGR_PEP_ID=MMETSP0795-20121207/11268_1 /TAXON_ID=88552 /ORGANISM="Amoebophrya sp., Strain Ameob2" /LENGTH=124 /DNA_ID=CAMNT_0020694627 /DNA_START=171 /DNA_END=543 /DNA_ORIENTATION=+
MDVLHVDESSMHHQFNFTTYFIELGSEKRKNPVVRLPQPEVVLLARLQVGGVSRVRFLAPPEPVLAPAEEVLWSLAYMEMGLCVEGGVKMRMYFQWPPFTASNAEPSCWSVHFLSSTVFVNGLW